MRKCKVFQDWAPGLGHMLTSELLNFFWWRLGVRGGLNTGKYLQWSRTYDDAHWSEILKYPLDQGKWEGEGIRTPILKCQDLCWVPLFTWVKYIPCRGKDCWGNCSTDRGQDTYPRLSDSNPMLAASAGSPEHVEAAYYVGPAAILGCSILVTSQRNCGGEPAREGWASAGVLTLPSCSASETFFKLAQPAS